MKSKINLKENLDKESLEFIVQNFEIANEKERITATNSTYQIIFFISGESLVKFKDNKLDFLSYQDAVDFVQV